MSGIISHVEDVNKKAANIAGDLYVFCNFNMDGYCYISAEGEFHNKIMLLYNIIHDTSIILQRIRYILCMDPSDYKEWGRIKSEINFKIFKKHSITIKILRACQSHNTSTLNGAIERNEIDFYENWKLQSCGKKEPETVEDYEKMVKILNKYDEDIYTWVLKLLDYISANANKDIIIKQWRDEIIRWYCTKRDIFYGQLEDAYNLLYMRENNHLPNNRIGIFYILNDWIRNSYCEPGIIELKKCDFLLFKAHKNRINESDFDKIKERIDQKKAEVLHNMERDIYKPILTHCDMNNKDELESENFADYFFQKDLKHLINQEILNKKVQSLLPQDILQVIITKRFMGITFDKLVPEYEI